MTPEQLEALEGIDDEAVNRIQYAINSFYGQEFDEPAVQDAGENAAAEPFPEDESAPEAEAGAEEAAVETAPDSAVDEIGESPASDTMVQSAESDTAAETGVNGHSAAESGDQKAP
jgi:hypothetical protein